VAPKDENDISDTLKRFLHDDLRGRGIVFNREVEVHYSRNLLGSGERTDLHVDTFRRGPSGEPSDLISVVVELKGCWNRNVFTSMETQLVDRYLRRGGLSHGLYVVGCFDSPVWTSKDSKHRHRCGGLTSLRDRLAAQAASLSQQDIHVTSYVFDAALKAQSLETALLEKQTSLKSPKAKSGTSTADHQATASPKRGKRSPPKGKTVA
jgi:hypothetical protein